MKDCKGMCINRHHSKVWGIDKQLHSGMSLCRVYRREAVGSENGWLAISDEVMMKEERKNNVQGDLQAFLKAHLPQKD